RLSLLIDGMFAVQRQTKRLDMMNLREYATYYNDLANMVKSLTLVIIMPILLCWE
ncbi:hypothetical protein OBE_13459, partial [human gut metagenome]